jgi:phytoene desaturase
MRNMPGLRAWGNYRSAVEHFFASPHLRQLYSRYPTYVGSSPYRSPATLAVIPYIEFAFGGYAVRGGLYTIVEGLVNLLRTRDVRLMPNAKVERIEAESGRTKSVRLQNGERLHADVVVVNGDAEYTGQMLGRPVGPRRSRSMSGFVQLFGLRKPLAGIREHTVCFSADYGREFSQIFDERRFPDDPTVYVNAPTPDTLFVMANAPGDGMDLDVAWSPARVAEARRRVMERLRLAGFPQFEDDIAVSDVWTPARLESAYLTPGGSIYGSDSHGWRNAFLRPANSSADVRGLYHVGGSTHPGGGTPTVLMSADIVCRQIGEREA